MSEIGDFNAMAGGVFTGTAQIAGAGANLVVGVGGKAIEVTGQLAIELLQMFTKFLGVCSSKAWNSAWKNIHAHSAQKVGNMSPQALMKRYGAELEIDKVVTSNMGYLNPETGKGLNPEIWKKQLEKNLKMMGIPFSSAPSYTTKDEKGNKMIVTPLIYPPLFAQRLEEARNMTIKEVEKMMKQAGWAKESIDDTLEKDAPQAMSEDEIKEAMERINEEYPDLCESADREAREMSVREETAYCPRLEVSEEDVVRDAAENAFREELFKNKISECYRDKDLVCHFAAEDIVENKEDFIKVRIKDTDVCAFFQKEDVIADGDKYVAGCDIDKAVFGKIDTNEKISFGSLDDVSKFVEENRRLGADRKKELADKKKLLPDKQHKPASMQKPLKRS